MNEFLADRPVVQVEAWPDPLLVEHGHHATSDYVEQHWLPVLGPSTLVLLRRLARDLDATGGAGRVDLTRCGVALGIPSTGRRGNALLRAFCRLQRYGMARVAGDRIQVRVWVGPVPRRHMIEEVS